MPLSIAQFSCLISLYIIGLQPQRTAVDTSDSVANSQECVCLLFPPPNAARGLSHWSMKTNNNLVSIPSLCPLCLHTPHHTLLPRFTQPSFKNTCIALLILYSFLLSPLCLWGSGAPKVHAAGPGGFREAPESSCFSNLIHYKWARKHGVLPYIHTSWTLGSLQHSLQDGI